MQKFGEFIVNHRRLIIIICLLLLIPSIIGIKATKINYDILSYLPDTVDTVKGQNILTDEFGVGSYSIVIIDNKMKDKIMMFLFKKTLYDNATTLNLADDAEQYYNEMLNLLDMRTCNCTIDDCKNCKDGYCELCK